MSRFILVLGMTTLILVAARTPGQEKEPPSSKKLQAEIARLKEEVKALLKEVRRRDEAILILTKEVKVIRQEAVAAQNALAAVKARLEDSLEQMKEKDRIIAGLRAAAGERAKKIPNFPSKYVKGTITKVDPQSGLVEIDLGKDAGIEKNHHLEAFRVQPRAEYLGRIRIVEVYERKSVGRLEMWAPKNRILQVGDSVASRLDKE
jgi:hypothetical protein